MTRMIRIALLLLALPLLAACGTDKNAPEPLSVVLEGSEFQFNTPTVTIQVGQPITLRFENKGVIDHALAVDEWNLEMEVMRPGESAELTFTPKETGTFSFYCAVPGHTAAGMTGTLRVTP